MLWNGRISNETERRGIFPVTSSHIAAGFVGIIAVNLGYPKLPGNVANPATYNFPVSIKRLDFEIEQLFAGDPNLIDMVVNAAKELEAEGASVIVGACGFFAHFQDIVANAVDVPVFLSSLTQINLINLGLKKDQKILVFAADGPSITDGMLKHVGADTSRIIVQHVGDRDAFQPIRWSEKPLDNGALIDDMCLLAKDACDTHPEIGAILMECSDLPPYSADVQAATGKPVYDFITLINWAHQTVAQKPYYGWL